MPFVSGLQKFVIYSKSKTRHFHMKKFLIPKAVAAPTVSAAADAAANSDPIKTLPAAAAAATVGGGPFVSTGPDLAKRKSPKPAVLTKKEESTVVPPAPTTNKVVSSSTNNKFSRSLLSNRQQSLLSNYITWQDGESVPYAKVVEIFEEIASVSGRLDKENLMSRLFTAVLTSTPNDLDSVVYLASNTIYPAYDGLELGIGDSLLIKAICEATGRKKDAVEDAYEKEGDLGEVAVLSRANQKTLGFAAKPKPLHAAYVLEQFRAIAQIKGEKAQARKVEIIKSLMVRCQGQEAKYLIRALQGKLRIGTAFQTVLVALSHTFADVQMAFLNDFPPQSCKEDKKVTSLSTKLAQSTSLSTSEMDVDNDLLQKITNLSVEESLALTAEEKERYLSHLLQEVHDLETPEARKLRLSYAQATTEDANGSYMASGLYDQAEIAIKRAFSECPNLSLVLQACTQYPLHHLYQQCRLLLGVPVAPMLAKPTKEIGEVLRRLENQAFTMEYKYDGERAQVHFWALDSANNTGAENTNGTTRFQVKIFSRNSEDNSNKYPDLKEVVLQSRLPFLQSCIVDAEVVAYDREKQTLLPFQILSTRKRKMETVDEPNLNFKNNSNNNHNTSNGNSTTFEEPKVKVILEVFDLLQINGQSLLRESLRTRRALLRLAFQPSSQNYFRFADGADHVENGDTAPIESLLTESCNNMCEGLMVKTLDEHASYEPSKRSLNWLKVKKDYISGMGVCDSVDLVPIGAYFGKGKRSGVYGAYLVACYEPERDVFQSVCKVGTGFTDEMLQHLYQKMSQRVLKSSKKPSNYEVGDALQADVWFTAASYSATQEGEEEEEEEEEVEDEVEKKEGEAETTSVAASSMTVDGEENKVETDEKKTPKSSKASLGGCVWEIQAADLSRSSVHRGGVGRIARDETTPSGNSEEVRGIGLRFPRFLRERDDKRPDQATTSEQIVDMFYSQSGMEKKDSDNEEDEWI